MDTSTLVWIIVVVLVLLALAALAVAVRLAALLVPGGIVVSGFGFDEAHLPPGAPILPLRLYDDAMTSAGFELVTRHSGWDGSPYGGGGYAVSVHGSGGR